MKQFCLRKTNIASSPEIAQLDSLPKGSLDPSTPGIRLFECFRALALACLRHGFIGCTIPNGERARAGRTDTLRPLGQETQSLWAKRIVMTGTPRLSGVGHQMTLVFPSGHVACWASQSIVKQVTLKPAAARVCQLVSSRIGPSKSI